LIVARQTQHGRPQGVVRMTNRTPVRDRPGAVGSRRGPLYTDEAGNAGGGTDLSSRRRTQYVKVPGTRRLGNLTTPESVQKLQKALPRESEGRSRLSFLRLYDKISREDIPGSCLRPVSLQQGRTGCGWTGPSRISRCMGAAMAWRTGACAQGRDVPTDPIRRVFIRKPMAKLRPLGSLDPAWSWRCD